MLSRFCDFVTGSSQELYELFADLKKMFHQTGYILQQVKQYYIIIRRTKPFLVATVDEFNMQLFAQHSISSKYFGTYLPK